MFGLFLYNILRPVYVFVIRVYGLFNGKAGKWVAGRKGWRRQMANILKPGEQRIWIHCSSVGEFEQAKPIVAALREQYPAYKILITFYSPSGYEANKNTQLADYVFYLPMDGSINASRFMDIVQPALAIFIKYEFWYHYLATLHKRGIPALLVSGAFRKGQPFFEWYGGFFRSMLKRFTFFYLQDERSERLLYKIGIHKNVVISGDTRYDRVAVIAKNAAAIAGIDAFKAGHRIYIAGSTWPGDEAVIHECLSLVPDSWKMIIAPHEIDADKIARLRHSMGVPTILYSELNAASTGADKKILIIDNIGMLSRLFAYGDIAYIGGGFQGGGIHNVLEPAVFGLPVIIGPVYEKFVEAKELAARKLIFPVSNGYEYGEILKKLIVDEEYRSDVSAALQQFMRDHTGATERVMEGIKKHNLL